MLTTFCFVVESISQNFADIQDHDASGQGAAWIRHNGRIAESQTWVGLKDSQGRLSVNRYCDNGVTKVVEQAFDRKPEHVKTDRSIMEAYTGVLNEAWDADKAAAGVVKQYKLEANTKAELVKVATAALGEDNNVKAAIAALHSKAKELVKK